jgi:hypothetical protein
MSPDSTLYHVAGSQKHAFLGGMRHSVMHFMVFVHNFLSISPVSPILFRPMRSGRAGAASNTLRKEESHDKEIGVIGSAVAACVLQGATVQAQQVADFNSAVTQAVMTNPRVNAAWYNFEATREAQRAAKGGYFPSVDLSAEIGREERETPWSIWAVIPVTPPVSPLPRCCLMASPPVRMSALSASPS